MQQQPGRLTLRGPVIGADKAARTLLQCKLAGTHPSVARAIDCVTMLPHIPDSTDPTAYPRRILLAVTGLAPQVVTETLYAIAVADQRRFVPTEVQLVTTREGAHRAKLALLSEDPGWFHRLRRDYALPPITFGPEQIHVLHDAAGEPLEDLRTAEDNERAADQITELVRVLTADTHTALHVSIAGGRKTLGFYLGYALSLFGRPQDRLSHVLVSEPFESSWDFFFPTPYSKVISVRDNQLADTAHARVTLAGIPFVSLRHGLPTQLVDGGAHFSEAVAAASRAFGVPELVIDSARCRIRAAGLEFPVPPTALALLCLFARRAADGLEPLEAPAKGVPDLALAKAYLRELHALGSPLADREVTERGLARGMDGEDFSMRLSRLHGTLRKHLGPAVQPYLVDGGRHRPRRYQLALPREAIRFHADGAPVAPGARGTLQGLRP